MRWKWHSRKDMILVRVMGAHAPKSPPGSTTIDALISKLRHTSTASPGHGTRMSMPFGVSGVGYLSLLIVR